MEDANRLVEYRGYRETTVNEVVDGVAIPVGTIVGPDGRPSPVGVASTPSDLVFDRLPPAADLSIGFTYTPNRHLAIRGSVFNAFDARYYQPDVFFDYEPRLEYLPNPWEDWRAYVSAEYSP
jgi:hypothetical protein